MNHIDQARRQLDRPVRALPRLEISEEIKSLFDFRYEHFRLVGYDPHPHIPAPIAV